MGSFNCKVVTDVDVHNGIAELFVDLTDSFNINRKSFLTRIQGIDGTRPLFFLIYIVFTISCIPFIPV